MFKKSFFYLVFICVAGTVSSQSICDSLFSKYSLPAKPNDTTSDFYFLQLTEAAPLEVKNKLILSATRKLSENCFIINNEILLRLFMPAKFQKKLYPANNYWKFSALTGQLSVSKKRDVLYRFTIQFENKDLFEKSLDVIPYLKQKKITISDHHFISFITTYENIEKYFLNDKNVTGIDVMLDQPREELATFGFDLSANGLNLVHSRYPFVNGSGEHVSIKEQYYDTTDIDIKGRYEYSPLASTVITNHANFMATIIAGAGNSVYYAKGAAWAARISSSSFEGVLPDPDIYYLQNNISVQNHSYGTSIDNNYGLNAVAFDKSANDNPGLLHVFSSGNSGTDTSKTGNYASIHGYANITGNFKMAKNVLVIGGVDSFGNVANLSSRGPAYDGRIIPELVAFQKNGTSEAAALVSGTLILLQQYYKIKNNNSVLPSALAKAILINTADDVNNPGPDYATGFGNMNAIKAITCINDNKIFNGKVSQGIARSFQFQVPENISLLKITLAWNDTAASAFASKALVNDLDLELTLPSTNELWKPWVLNPYPNADSLNTFATRKRDSLNNEEQITLQNPKPGKYQINVRGFNVVTANQNFYIAYGWDSLNYFNWQRLSGSDFAEGGKSTILRWQTSFNGLGTVEYRYTKNNNWNLISNADLSKQYFKWNPPDTIAQALLRMKIGNTYYYSDTFLIITLLNPKTGFICGDSILIYWDKIKGINKYKLFGLGENYMEPFSNVSDTFSIISQNNLANHFLAVSPVLPDMVIGPKSYAFDYTLQGAGCFISSFFVNVNGNVARLVLDIGTLYHVANISFEKLSPSGYITIFSPAVNNGLEYKFNYLPLTNGITYFRAKITLTNGQIIYSISEAVFYVEPGKYLLLPVPVNRNTDITIYTTTPDGEIISLIDVMGRIVLKKEIQFTHELIKTSILQAGQYFYKITKNGLKVASGKLIVL
jgi:hypothetical protein